MTSGSQVAGPRPCVGPGLSLRPVAVTVPAITSAFAAGRRKKERCLLVSPFLSRRHHLPQVLPADCFLTRSVSSSYKVTRSLLVTREAGKVII